MRKINFLRLKSLRNLFTMFIRKLIFMPINHKDRKTIPISASKKQQMYPKKSQTTSSTSHTLGIPCMNYWIIF